MIIIRALVAVIHACLKAAASAALALSSLFISAVVLLALAAFGLSALGFTGAGGLHFFRSRRRQRDTPVDGE